MSEFAPTIATPANAGTTSINTGMPQMGAENASGFSSKGLGMFKDIRSDSSQGIIDIQNGTGKDAEFQRSESFESQVQDSASLFDVSNPYAEQQFDSFDLAAPSIEDVSTQPLREQVEAPIDRNKEFTDLLSNSVVLWERPDSKLKGYDAYKSSGKNAEEPTLLVESTEQEIAGTTAEEAPDMQAATNVGSDFEQQNEAFIDNVVNTATQQENEAVFHASEQNPTETLVEPKIGMATSTSTEEATSAPEPALGSIVITETKTENAPAAQPQLEAAQKIEAKTTVTALEAVREEVRLMPDTDEVTITLAQPLTELQTQTMPEVMDMESLEQLLETQEAVDVKTEATQVQPSTDTEEATTMAGEKPTDPTEEDETKITIKKAWFEQDVAANQNRKIEIIKAYALVHYRWLRQYIGSVEGSEVADVIKKHRDREKLESMSIKAIEKDGSVDPFATTIERAQEIDSPEELDDLLEEAEEQFSATNFTSRPTKEIVDGEQIDYVHNGQEIFQANLDGEEVKVIMNGARTAKKPEFIKVEME